jgi:hypothetical protein
MTSSLQEVGLQPNGAGTMHHARKMNAQFQGLDVGDISPAFLDARSVLASLTECPPRVGG